MRSACAPGGATPLPLDESVGGPIESKLLDHHASPRPAQPLAQLRCSGQLCDGVREQAKDMSREARDSEERDVEAIRSFVADTFDRRTDRGLALHLGEAARRFAMERFNIGRFARDWDEAFRLVTGSRRVTGMSRRRPAGARSITNAVAVPVKIPADRPETMRPA